MYPVPGFYQWINLLAKASLFLFGIVLFLWKMKWNTYVYILLTLLWVLDRGSFADRFRQSVREPFVLAILVFCGLLALGLIWTEYPIYGEHLIWKRYFVYLVFIPYVSLLNRERLPWAVAGFLIGYACVAGMGVFQLMTTGEQGVVSIAMSYMEFSFMLGVGFLVSVYVGGRVNDRRVKAALWCLAAVLLLMQFQQYARGPLVATVLSSMLLIVITHGRELRKVSGLMTVLILLVLVFSWNSHALQKRIMLAEQDITLSQENNYNTSLGYRIAVWDIGLHGIMQRPLTGYGTGMAQGYLDRMAATYKGGIYRDTPKFAPTSHFHNDWIDIGMRVGVPGMLVLAFLLWGWLQIFRNHGLTALGMSLAGLILIFGCTETLVVYRKILTFLLVVTALAVGWQRVNRQPGNYQSDSTG